MKLPLVQNLNTEKVNNTRVANERTSNAMIICCDVKKANKL